MSICFIVSSNKITPPINFFIPLAENNASLNLSLFSGLDFTLIASNRFCIVPVLSSAAKIPLPFETIFNAV